jgi:hypothetical protein
VFIIEKNIPGLSGENKSGWLVDLLINNKGVNPF